MAWIQIGKMDRHSWLGLRHRGRRNINNENVRHPDELGVERLTKKLGDTKGSQTIGEEDWEIRSGYGKIFSWKTTCQLS